MRCRTEWMVDRYERRRVQTPPLPIHIKEIPALYACIAALSLVLCSATCIRNYLGYCDD
jgi:hypothetical protein